MKKNSWLSHFRRIGQIIIIFGCTASLQAQVPPPTPPQEHPIALKGGILHPISSAPIESGTILWENGKITALGKDIPLPSDTDIIDIQGKHVFPGLIDANSTLGLIEIEAVRATRDTSETGVINPNIHAERAINPDSELIPVTRANGILTALVVPQGSLITGQSALIMLDGWTWEDMILKAPVALHIFWPRMTPISAWWFREPEDKQQEQIKKNLDTLTSALRNARAYDLARSAPEAQKIEIDQRWEAMRPVLHKELPVFIHADSVAQIKSAVAWALEEGLQMVLVGGQEAPLVSDLLRAHQIPVIVGPILDLPAEPDAPYDEAYTVPARLQEAGIPFCIGGESGAAHERNLPYHASMAVAFGLPEKTALEALTLTCARILGVDDRIGSLEPGKDATLIVTDGNPLDIRTHVLSAYIQGRPIDLNNRHLRLYHKYIEKARQEKTLVHPLP